MVITGSPNQTYTYGYDNADRLTSIQNPFSETTNFDYDDANRLTKQTFANGSYLAYDYDDRDRVTAISSKKANNTWQWQHAYEYDGADNVLIRWDYPGDPTDDPFQKTVFEYDAANQLKTETSTNHLLQTLYTRSYAYDHNGNRTSLVKNGVTTTCAYDWQDRLTSATTGSSVKTYLYDNNGNCNEIKVNGTTTATLGYDYENRVTSIAQTGVTTNTFTYNGINLRVGKGDSGGTFSYLCDGASPASPVLKDGAATYTPGVSERRSSTSKFYHTDAIGSVRGITDSSQNTTDTALYDGFGNVVQKTTPATTPTPFGFAGAFQYQTDGDTSLQLLGNRYYDPSIGRFLSKDPIKDGDNWYSNCKNNPVKWIDPEGLSLKGDLAELFRRILQAGGFLGSIGIGDPTEKIRLPEPPPVSRPGPVGSPPTPPLGPLPPNPPDPSLGAAYSRRNMMQQAFEGMTGRSSSSGGGFGGFVTIGEGAGVFASGMKEVVRYRRKLEHEMKQDDQEEEPLPPPPYLVSTSPVYQPH